MEPTQEDNVYQELKE